MAAQLLKVNTGFPPRDYDWISAESTRLGLSRSELVRQAVSHFRNIVPPAPAPAATEPAPGPPTEIRTEETTVARPRNWNSMPTKKKAKYTAENPLPVELRVVPPKTTCPRCERTDCWAGADGTPKPHLRPSRPGETDYSTEVPTMTPCLP